MTATWVDDLPGVDTSAPIEWSLTSAAEMLEVDPSREGPS